MLIGGHVDRIVLSRPAVEAGERLGFLPGDMREKLEDLGALVAGEAVEFDDQSDRVSISQHAN